MGRIVVWIALAAIAWLVVQRTARQTPPAPERTVDARPAPMAQASFHCDGRRYCNQMHSRAEAEYFLKHCPGMRMDGDNDGILCENDSRF